MIVLNYTESESPMPYIAGTSPPVPLRTQCGSGARPLL